MIRTVAAVVAERLRQLGDVQVLTLDRLPREASTMMPLTISWVYDPDESRSTLRRNLGRDERLVERWLDMRV